MSAAKHTPGPWTAEKRSGDEWWFGGHDGAEIVVRDPANMHDAICVIGASLSTEGKADADARLIAAAPELLEAARNYAMRYAQDEAAEDGPEHTGCSEQQALDARALFAAIRKATGEAA